MSSEYEPRNLNLRTVGILLFDRVEVLDFAGPFEVFSAARPVEEHGDEHILFTAKTIAEKSQLITTTGGLRVQPDYTIEDHPPLDILVVPGGRGTRQERHNKKLLDWVKKQNQTTELTTSVCTGVFILAEAGLLKGHKATTHRNGMEWMKEVHPETTMIEDTRFVDEGHIITSAGISAGIDMSLHVVGRLHGKEVAVWTARRMEYNWRSPQRR